MRESFDRLLREITLLTLALAIAIGWALFQVANGVSQLISTFLIDYPASSDIFTSVRYSQPLTWLVADRVLTFGPLLEGLVEFAVVLTVGVLLYRRSFSPRRG